MTPSFHAQPPNITCYEVLVDELINKISTSRCWAAIGYCYYLCKLRRARYLGCARKCVFDGSARRRCSVVSAAWTVGVFMLCKSGFISELSSAFRDQQASNKVFDFIWRQSSYFLYKADKALCAEGSSPRLHEDRAFQGLAGLLIKIWEILNI